MQRQGFVTNCKSYLCKASALNVAPPLYFNRRLPGVELYRQFQGISTFPCSHRKRRLGIALPVRNENETLTELIGPRSCGDVAIPYYYHSLKRSHARNNVVEPKLENEYPNEQGISWPGNVALTDEHDDVSMLSGVKSKWDHLITSINILGASTHGGTGIKNVSIDYSVKGRVLSIREINAIKRTLHHKIWKALCGSRWDEWEMLFQRFKALGLAYDEVSYTLRLNGYVLSHRHQLEKAYLVIAEMKEAQMHPAIIRMNEGLLNSYIELHGIFCGPTRVGWQCICRMAWHSAVRLRRRREKQLRENLYQENPNDVLAMDKKAIDDLMEKAYIEALVVSPSALQGNPASAIGEEPYDFMDQEPFDESELNNDHVDMRDVGDDASLVFSDSDKFEESDVIHDSSTMESENSLEHEEVTHPLEFEKIESHTTASCSRPAAIVEAGLPPPYNCLSGEIPSTDFSSHPAIDIDSDDEIDFLENGEHLKKSFKRQQSRQS